MTGVTPGDDGMLAAVIREAERIYQEMLEEKRREGSEVQQSEDEDP